MTTTVEKRFAVAVVYNGVTKPIEVQPAEQVVALLQKAIAAFGITQNPHLLSLFREDGTVVPEHESVEKAGLKPGEVLLLRPNAVKGGGGLLHLAEGLLQQTFRTLRACGKGRCECVIYWTGPTLCGIADGIEHPVHRRSAIGYSVDDNWLTKFCNRLASTKRSVKVQVHTHPGEAFHSTTDDLWPIVSQAGFLSVVIPNFAMGQQSLDMAWIGQLGPDGTWRELSGVAKALAFS